MRNNIIIIKSNQSMGKPEFWYFDLHNNYIYILNILKITMLNLSKFVYI